MLRNAFISLALCACLVAACGGDGGDDRPPAQSLSGLVTDVGVDPAGAVTTLTVIDDAGVPWSFAVQFEAGAVVDALHLRGRRDEKLPVVVHYRTVGDYRIAFRVDDG